MLRLRVMPLALIALLSAGAPAILAAQTAGASNDELRTAIVERLQDKDGFERVTLTVDDGVVTLNGTVASLWHVDQAIERTRKTKGVQSVVSYLTIEQGESDEWLRAEVAKKIRSYVFYTIFDSVDLQVDDGNVVLTGYVTEEYRAEEIARLASHVTGVRTLDNRIEVLPASIFDGQLRTKLAVAIYNHPLFSHLAFQTNPPLHIVVKNSRVILTGVVNTEAQRTLAEHIALSTFGVLGVNNRLALDSELT